MKLNAYLTLGIQGYSDSECLCRRIMQDIIFDNGCLRMTQTPGNKVESRKTWTWHE